MAFEGCEHGVYPAAIRVKAVTIESTRGRGEVEVARGRVKKGGTDRG